MGIIKYFTKTGDQKVSEMFTSYIWKERGFDRILDKIIAEKRYGDGLDMILIQYYVEGEFAVNGPESPKVNNYSKNNKDISVSISVTKNLFHNKNEFERREFIVDSTLNAIKLVKDRLVKKKLDIDFDKLLQDVQNVAQEYLKYPEPYSDI